ALDILPSGIRNRISILVRQVNGVHHFAVDIQLQLLISRVSNAYWPRVLVATEVAESNFIELLPAIHAIHYLQGTALCVVTQAPFQPINECGCFFHETEPNQRIQRESRIPQPCVAIVPVPHSPNALRERERWRGDQ